MSFRVVLIDDVTEIRLILCLLLEQTGWFEVVGQAGDGIEGLAVVESTRPDLVLLDVEMPGPSGWTVLPALKDAVPGVAVVILSGSAVDETPPDEDSRLASAVLPKGMPTEELVAALLAVLSARDAPDRGEFDAGGALDPTMTPSPVVTPTAEPTDAHLRSLVDSSPDGIIGTGPDGIVSIWNHAAERMYGLAEPDAIGRHVGFIVSPERPGEVDRIRRRLDDGEPSVHLEAVAIRPDGSRLPVALGFSAIWSPDHTLAGLSVNAKDISQRRSAEAALVQAVAQLEHQNRELARSNLELDAFASIASHDLAQPLQVAYGYLEMLTTDYAAELPDVAAAWLDSSLRSLDRMRLLVKDILRYARTGAGDVAFESVDLNEAASLAVGALSEAVAEQGATIDVGDLPVVMGSRAQLTAVFQNLFANAIKFTPTGRAPHVTVRAAENGEAWTVTVGDNGPGVPVPERERIFDMFQRNHGREVAGAGLGLAICKKVVRLHGGRIMVGSAPGGEGSLFSFTLPIVSENPSGAPNLRP